MRISGIHHITAIAGDPSQNIGFYTAVLGLQLVKRTVNFDDPGSYHFYFGDELGHPGTIITFFSWPGAARGRLGGSQVGPVSFAVPEHSFDHWKAKLRENGLSVEELPPRFSESALRFADKDGLNLELVASRGLSGAGQGVQGFAAATLRITRRAETEKLLVDVLGFKLMAEENDRRRFRGSGRTAASMVDTVSGDEAWGRIAVGTVHHIAFRAADETEQLHWRERLIASGFAVSPVLDRNYFRSIYFREPSGILFEIATDGPGFTVDEAAGELGQNLKLPPVFEPMRAEIERVLPPLDALTVV